LGDVSTIARDRRVKPGDDEQGEGTRPAPAVAREDQPVELGCFV
jgi:hypothetical protein